MCSGSILGLRAARQGFRRALVERYTIPYLAAALALALCGHGYRPG